jgi:hypothetical protein
MTVLSAFLDEVVGRQPASDHRLRPDEPAAQAD